MVPKLLRQSAVLITVFITGACVLVIEIVAIRVLSPYFGNTIFTVSSVLSTILAALSIGYYAGGKLADRHPSRLWFSSIIFASGLLVAGFFLLGIVALPPLSLVLSPIVGPLVSALFFFFVPALLLGTLSPYAVKLQSLQSPEDGVGSVAGKVFFFSTLGSITGSLLAGFVLVPTFGVQGIFLGTGFVLTALGFLGLASAKTRRRLLFSCLCLLLLAASLILAISVRAESYALFEKDGIYEKIIIYDGQFQGRPARFFQQDRSASGAMFLDSNDPTDLVYDYTKYYSVYKLAKPKVEAALVIGGGAYSVPKAILADSPGATVDAVEIEPSLFSLAEEYFDLRPSSNLRNYTEDGRRFLRDTGQRYDLIFSDVYQSVYSMPPHFTTQEFFQLAHDRLAEEGFLVVNLLADLSRTEPSLFLAEMRTFQSVFPNSYVFATNSPSSSYPQNIMLVGYKSDRKIDFENPEVLQHPDALLRSLHEKQVELGRFDFSSAPLLTDDFAPIERLVGKFFRQMYGEATLTSGAEMLASVAQQLGYGPRYVGAEGHRRVQDFLVAEMRQHAHQLEVQEWSHVGSDGQVHELKNIIGRFNPGQDRRIILGTHYDSKRLADMDPDAPGDPVPGANDSASGVAVLTEVARILASSQTSGGLGVDIIFFDGEEGERNQGSDYASWKPLGSSHFAENIPSLYRGPKPFAGLVVDMVCAPNLKIYKEQSSSEQAPDVLAAFWEKAQGVAPEVFRSEVGPEVRDDHTPLNAAGIPSILLIDIDDPYHHTTQDTLDKCNAESLESVAGAILRYVTSL